MTRDANPVDAAEVKVSHPINDAAAKTFAGIRAHVFSCARRADFTAGSRRDLYNR